MENSTNNATSHMGSRQQMLHKWNSFPTLRAALRIDVYNQCYLTKLHPALKSLWAASIQCKQTPVLAALTAVLLEAI